MSVTSIRLKSELEQPLEALSKKMDRSKNYLINTAIKEYLEKKQLNEQRWQETLPALESLQSGMSIDEEAVNQWLDSWGMENELLQLKPPRS